MGQNPRAREDDGAQVASGQQARFAPSHPSPGPRRPNRFRGESAFRTFLHRVCANVALRHLRWWRRRPEESVCELPDIACGAASPKARAEAREAQVLVARALERLSAKKRIVFVFHELVGLGPEEMALAVGVSPNTVRSRLHSGRLEFTQAMRGIVQDGKRNASTGST